MLRRAGGRESGHHPETGGPAGRRAGAGFRAVVMSGHEAIERFIGGGGSFKTAAYRPPPVDRPNVKPGWEKMPPK